MIRGIFLSVLLLAAVNGGAQSAGSFEDVISLRAVTGTPSISPDGAAVVFSVRGANWQENRFETELWLARKGQPPQRLVDGAAGPGRWGRRSEWLAFSKPVGGKPQLHVMRVSGGEAIVVTTGDEGVGAYDWHPDGTTLAFVRQDAASAAMKSRDEDYGSFVVEGVDQRMNHFWTIDVTATLNRTPESRACAGEEQEDGDSCLAPASAERLTTGDFSVMGFDWAPDGTKIVLSHRADPRLRGFPESDISIVDVATKTVTPLVVRPGPDYGAVWSPDSASVAFLTANGNNQTSMFATTQIARIEVAGGSPVRLAADFDEDPFGLEWTRRGIFFVAFDKTRSMVYRLNPNSGTVKVEFDDLRNVYGVDYANDGAKMALVAHLPTTLPEVYMGTARRFERVTNMSSQIDGWSLATSEVIEWQSRDGTTIEGVLRKPADFDPTRRYPLFVVIHGGPTGIDRLSPIVQSVYPIDDWLAKGAVVLQPNYRGSAGYGGAFRSLNYRNLGVGDAWDVLSGVDHLVELGFVDTDRMGAMGWSQGGYISAFLTTNSDRFAAISVGAGISNWMTYYVNTDIPPFTRQYLGATPWDDPAVYALTSPMTNIKAASTPTLIQHGEFDRRVPTPNAYELAMGLSDVGVETEIIIYKGFGHGIDKPKERLAAVWHNWRWFARHIWGEVVDLPIGEVDLPIGEVDLPIDVDESEPAD